MDSNYTPKHERETDFQKLDKLILSLEHNADTNQLTVEMLRKYQEAFNKFNDKYINDPSFGPKDKNIFKPLEFRALIFLAQGDDDMADSLLKKASELKHADEDWVSETAEKWEASNAVSLVDINTDKTQQFSGKLEGWLALYALGFFLSPLLLLYDLFSSVPQFRNELTNLTRVVANDFQSLLNFDIFYDVVSLVFLGVLAALFFQKKRATRPVAIAFHGFILIGGFITFSMLDSLSKKYGVELTSGGSILTAGSFLWPLYWIFSKRVKATFTK